MIYVQVASCYDKRPAIIAFEYLLSGMACIATNTLMNRLIVDKSNGVLCNDTPESFASALSELSTIMFDLNSENILRDSYKWGWENICNDNFFPLISL